MSKVSGYYATLFCKGSVATFALTIALTNAIKHTTYYPSKKEYPERIYITASNSFIRASCPKLNNTQITTVTSNRVKGKAKRVFRINGALQKNNSAIDELLEALKFAPPGTTTYHIILDSTGGLALVGEKIAKAMKNSKAKTVVFYKEASSAAIDILVSADEVYAEKESYSVFHTTATGKMTEEMALQQGYYLSWLVMRQVNQNSRKLLISSGLSEQCVKALTRDEFDVRMTGFDLLKLGVVKAVVDDYGQMTVRVNDLERVEPEEDHRPELAF